MPPKIDPITRSVVQHRLSSIVAEMGEAMLRTSYSQILNSSRDFSLAICDTRARLIEPIETLRSQPEPYIALRRNYSSQREAAIRNGETEADPYQDLPDFDVYDEESAEGTGAGDQ